MPCFNPRQLFLLSGARPDPICERLLISPNIPKSFPLFKPAIRIDRYNSAISLKLSLTLWSPFVLFDLLSPDAPFDGPQWW